MNTALLIVLLIKRDRLSSGACLVSKRGTHGTWHVGTGAQAIVILLRLGVWQGVPFTL